jgi:hypothetical protein
VAGISQGASSVGAARISPARPRLAPEPSRAGPRSRAGSDRDRGRDRLGRTGRPLSPPASGFFRTFSRNLSKDSMVSMVFGGEEGIRTLDTALDRITV